MFGPELYSRTVAALLTSLFLTKMKTLPFKIVQRDPSIWIDIILIYLFKRPIHVLKILETKEM